MAKHGTIILQILNFLGGAFTPTEFIQNVRIDNILFKLLFTRARLVCFISMVKGYLTH